MMLEYLELNSDVSANRRFGTRVHVSIAEGCTLESLNSGTYQEGDFDSLSEGRRFRAGTPRAHC
jgi:hypothetical protein